MTAALQPDPDGRPQDDVVTVPRAEYRRLRALRRLASPQALDDGDAAAAAEEFRDGVAAGRPGAITQAQARQLNRLDWYSAHGWAVPYPETPGSWRRTRFRGTTCPPATWATDPAAGRPVPGIWELGAGGLVRPGGRIGSGPWAT